MGGILTEDDFNRWEMQKKQQQQLDDWQEKAMKAQALMQQQYTQQQPSTNPPSSSRIPESGEKLSLQIRIIGEQSSGVRLLKKEYLIELPCSGVELGVPHLALSGQITDAVVIPLKSQPQPSDSPEAVTPPQHESKVIG